MRLGIFAKTFVRPSLAETLDAVAARGLDCIQFNFSCAGLPTLPEKIAPELIAQIREQTRLRQLEIVAVSGTFNMIDVDVAKRQEGLRRLDVLAGAGAALGVPLISLCTGTRDPKDLWRHHADNESPEAWRDLLQSMESALKTAHRHGVYLGVEPETANVVSSARKARRLLDELRSPRLKIIIDPANLFHPGETAHREDVLGEAFDLLGGDIMLAHAKDFREGIVPWAHYIQLLRVNGFAGPLVLHGMPEEEVNNDVAFLRQKMTEAARPVRLPISSEFFRDGVHFHYQDAGRGIPFFYQHGLGGDVNQPFGLFQPPAGFRMISFDCRGHGQTRPLGPEEKISMATFSDDLLALMDHLRIERAVIGGISMGAAVALNFAVRHPERVRGLVLQRPAWLDQPRGGNVGIYSEMARLIRQHGPVKGMELFKLAPSFQKAFKQSQPGAKSLLAHFLDPLAAERVALLERIPVDSPHADRARWRALAVPTLVLASRQDEVHPFDFGLVLAEEIPGAEFQELTPKAVSVEQHNADVQRFLESFLLDHF